jgi:hypothetical protein
MMSKYATLHSHFEIVKRRTKSISKALSDYDTERWRSLFTEEERSMLRDLATFVEDVRKSYEKIHDSLKTLKLALLFVDENKDEDYVENAETFVNDVCCLVYPNAVRYENVHSVLIAFVKNQQTKIARKRRRTIVPFFEKESLEEIGTDIEIADVSYEFEVLKRMTVALVVAPMHKIFLPLNFASRSLTENSYPMTSTSSTIVEPDSPLDRIVKKALFSHLSTCGIAESSVSGDVINDDTEDSCDEKYRSGLVESERRQSIVTLSKIETRYASLTNANEIRKSDRSNCSCSFGCREENSCYDWTIFLWDSSLEFLNRMRWLCCAFALNPITVDNGNHRGSKEEEEELSSY